MGHLHVSGIHLHDSGIVLSYKKGTFILCDSIDGLGDYYAK